MIQPSGNSYLRIVFSVRQRFGLAMGTLFTVTGTNAFIIYVSLCLASTIAGQLFFGRGREGGELDLAKPRVGGWGKNPCNFLKFDFLKSLQLHPILKIGNSSIITFSLHLSITIGGKGDGSGQVPGNSPS